MTARPGQTAGQLHNVKLAGLYQYLWDMGSNLPPDDLILLVDGHDTLLQMPAEHVLERYYEINKDRKRGEERIVTGADKGERIQLLPVDSAVADRHAQLATHLSRRSAKVLL